MIESQQQIVQAAENMDWEQVVQNGGPPCFFLQYDGRFCGRAQRWEGHDDDHQFVSFKQVILSAIERATEDLYYCDGNGYHPVHKSRATLDGARNRTKRDG